MDSNSPLILIDFDGVFNAVAQMPWEAAWEDMEDSFFTEDDNYRIPVTFSPSVISFFHRIKEDAEIIWLTTWRSDTKFFPKAFGFPEFPWLDELPGPYTRNWWKADVIAEIPKERRILWIDDEIPLDESSEEQREIWSRKGRMEFIKPKPSVGLTPEHLELITNFIQKDI